MHFSRESRLCERVCPSVGWSVRRSVGLSVRPSVRDIFVKIAENGVMQDGDASYFLYTTLSDASTINIAEKLLNIAEKLLDIAKKSLNVVQYFHTFSLKQGRIHDIRCVLILHYAIFSDFYKSVTDARTNGRTDTPSYRDARTHLTSLVTKCQMRPHLSSAPTAPPPPPPRRPPSPPHLLLIPHHHQLNPIHLSGQK